MENFIFEPDERRDGTGPPTRPGPGAVDPPAASLTDGAAGGGPPSGDCATAGAHASHAAAPLCPPSQQRNPKFVGADDTRVVDGSCSSVFTPWANGSSVAPASRCV
jgi:hypothetical protein